MKSNPIYKIKNERDFWMALKRTNRCLNNIFVLESDLVFHEKKSVYLNKSVVILGKGHHIYYPQDNLFEGSFLETSLVPYRECIKLKQVRDLEKMRTIKNGTVIVEVLNDLEDYTFEAIDLKDYVGNLIILGNHHTIKNIKIRGNNYNGFIGRISSASSLRVKDLELNGISLIHKNASYAGFLLGAHEDESKLRSICSPVVVKNTVVKNCKMDFASKGMGILMGNYNEELYVKNAYTHNNRRAGHVLIQSLVGEVEILDGYVYDSLDNQGPMLRRTKKN